MMTASVYQPKTASPTSLGLVVLIHGAAIAALVFAKMEMPAEPDFPPTQVEFITVKPPPDPVRPDPQPRVKPTVIRHVEPLVPPPPRPDDAGQATQSRTTASFGDPPEPYVPPIPEPPPQIREPVRLDARIDPSSDLKPPYPLSERRAGAEGSVTVRVRIGTDGKVRSAEKVRATNDAFVQATLRHVLRNWRFKPATLDGRPIETSKVMTVHFTLEGEDG